MARARWVQARLLVRPVVRTIRWLPMPASGALGTFIVYAGLHERGGGNPHLPFVAIALCLSAAFLLDDPTAETVGGTPTPLLLRRGVQIIVGLPALLAIWGAILAYAGFGAFHPTMWVEFAGMLALTLALAAIGARIIGSERAGMFAAPALMLVLVVSAFVPARWRPLPLDPVATGWFDLYGRWTIALVVSSAVFLIAGRDPARANPIRRKALGVLRHPVVSSPPAPQAVR
jgi:hypothetical protein